ncbi:hypothetical protein PI125_g3386 [Phytophthora idaei]|nr:hypothetical protein PI125_g3386 [Phytophthora idaei]
MGVATAPDEFQAVMNRCVSDLDFRWVYLDDILILSTSFEQHVQHVRIVLEHLRENGLTIHGVKSKIGATAVEYLGYTISRERISPLQSKVDAIGRIAAPRNRHEPRHFVGMIVWPRRAHLLAPLTALTSPQRNFLWGRQRPMPLMMAALVQATELAFPDYSSHFDLHIDASGFKLGAVISQRGQLITFWSKKCNDSQRKYAATKLELLSIVIVLREYSMLLGQDVRIHTDHLNLAYGTFNNWQAMR